jgi:anaerobic magnesium-protoporphyrin IX monomethyl ester cyclase
MNKVLLCIPPDYDYNYPPLATPALCAFLKKNKITASQIDLNLGYRDFLLDHMRGKNVSPAVKNVLLKDALRVFFAEKLKKRYYSALLPRVSDGVSLSLPYNNNSNSSFYFTERLLESRDLFRYLEDRAENTFLQFYEKRGIAGFLERNGIDLVGLSVTSPSQVIPSLTLGCLIKKNLPHIHVNIGGQWPTLYRKQIIKRQDLFTCFDSVVVFEGETPLLKLAQALKTRPPLKIRNVVTKGASGDFSSTRSQEHMDSLPAPDFSGLPVSRYRGARGSRRSLTFESSRGCYWSKCAYCVDLPLPKPAYRCKDPKAVVRDMRELQKKFNATMLMFGDPGLSPRSMLEISRGILARGLRINWWTMARLDPGFTREIFSTARKAGLVKINFGFESACDRVCALVNKGNSRERSERIIRDCHEAGIVVDLQTMVGLPGESPQDGLETVDFLIRNKKYIGSVSFNEFYLTPGNQVYLHPDRFGITYDRKTVLPFRFFIPFTNVKGMDSGQVRSLIETYYALRERTAGSATESTRDPAKTPGQLTFGLNGESVTLRYIRTGSKEIELI